MRGYLVKLEVIGASKPENNGAWYLVETSYEGIYKSYFTRNIDLAQMSEQAEDFDYSDDKWPKDLGEALSFEDGGYLMEEYFKSSGVELVVSNVKVDRITEEVE